MLLPKLLRSTSLWLLLGALLLGLASRSYSQSVQQAGLVVVSGDGTVTTRCVSFMTETISGIDLLRQSELALETQHDAGLGEFVCKIGAVGCPPSIACVLIHPPIGITGSKMRPRSSGKFRGWGQATGPAGG